MDIEHLQKNWEQLGRADPWWAILAAADKKGNKWNIDEFFATGQGEIDAIIGYVGSLGIKIPAEKALDFGCGAGRLTQGLARYFDQVCGVDIAPSMIELAKKYNRYGDKCRYCLNQTDDLKLFSDNSFNLIYATLTLQHMKPRYSKGYIKEFMRILVPHGVLIFDLPSHPTMTKEGGIINLKGLIMRIVPKSLLDATYRKVRYGNKPRDETYWMEEKKVLNFLKANKARIVDVKRKQGPILVHCQYCVTKE